MSLSKPAVEMAVEIPLDNWEQTTPLDTQVVVQLEVVDGRRVACQAAQADGLSRALRLRGRTLAQLYCDQKGGVRAAANAVSHALSLQAQRQEDIAAANALRGYYTRIAVAEQAELLTESQQRLEGEEVKQLALLQEGVATGVDMSGFQRQRVELEDQRLQLASQERQLRLLLEQLTQRDWAMERIAYETLDVRAQQLDTPRLQAMALRQRSDLLAWRHLIKSLDTDSAAGMLNLLSALPGGWSIPIPDIGLLRRTFCTLDNDCLAANLTAELRAVEQTLSDTIRYSVGERCEKLTLGYERMRLSQQAVESWRGRIEQFVALEEQGEVRPEQKGEALRSLLVARGVEIQRRLEARLAEVDLAEALGGLAERCCSGEAWLVGATSAAAAYGQ